MRKIFNWLFIAILAVGLWYLVRTNKSSDAKSSKKKEEKVLNLVCSAQIAGLDPAVNADLYCSIEMNKVYEGLLEFDYLARPHKLIPNLAESMPTISGDGLTYTFNIRKDVFFQDNKCFKDGKGRRLKAQDFVYSIKRVADPKLQSPVFEFLDGRIDGLSEWHAKYVNAEATDYSCEIEGLKALDDYTVQFKLTKPCPQFLNFLAMHMCFAVPEEAVKFYGKDFLNNPVGTGAFVIEKFNPQENKVVAVRNPTFRKKYFPEEAANEFKHMLVYAGKELPLVDKIVTNIITEDQPKMLKFQNGDLDIIAVSGPASVNVIKNHELTPEFTAKGIKLILTPEVGTCFWVLNCTKEPLNNTFLRQAMSLAFDRQKEIEMFRNGLAIPAQSIIPPGLEGNKVGYINKNNVFNLEEAKKLMVKAGYPGGKGLSDITINTVSDSLGRQIAEFFANCMSQIGIKVKVEMSSWPEMVNKASAGNTQIHGAAWGADYADAENFFMILYKSDERKGGVNAHYKNDKFNELYEKAAVMNPSPERTLLYEQINEMVANEVPIICTEHRLHPALYHGWVKNYVWSDFLQYTNWLYIDIDLQRKAELLPKLKK